MCQQGLKLNGYALYMLKSQYPSFSEPINSALQYSSAPVLQSSTSVQYSSPALQSTDYRHPVQTQLSSIPVQQADAEPPEKERQIQVMAQRPVLDAQLTLASQHVSHSKKSLLLLSNCLPQIALEALSEHENTKKISGACPKTP